VHLCRRESTICSYQNPDSYHCTNNISSLLDRASPCLICNNRIDSHPRTCKNDLSQFLQLSRSWWITNVWLCNTIAEFRIDLTSEKPCWSIAHFLEHAASMIYLSRSTIHAASATVLWIIRFPAPASNRHTEKKRNSCGNYIFDNSKI